MADLRDVERADGRVFAAGAPRRVLRPALAGYANMSGWVAAMWSYSVWKCSQPI